MSFIIVHLIPLEHSSGAPFEVTVAIRGRRCNGHALEGEYAFIEDNLSRAQNAFGDERVDDVGPTERAVSHQYTFAGMWFVEFELP